MHFSQTVKTILVASFCAVGNSIAYAQTAVSDQVVIAGEEVPSAYGAPPALSRARFSNLVNAYVLPPGSVYAGLVYQGDALRFNRPDHRFTQEIPAEWIERSGPERRRLFHRDAWTPTCWQDQPDG